VRIVIQQRITGPLAEGIGGIIGNFLGGSSSATSTTTASSGSYFTVDSSLALGNHGGSVVGADPPTFYRFVPSVAFAGAPRFHGGFAPGEYPAILQKGEGVFTAGQMKALGLLANNGANSTPQSVEVNVVNQSGQEMRVSNTKATYDAQRLIVTLWMDAAERNAYGLRNMLGG